MWENHAAWLFGTAPVRFDDMVTLLMPEVTENQHVFPITVDARAVPGVQRIVVLMDLNPLPLAIDHAPQGGRGYVALRVKLDQRTPVRAAALDGQGLWHVAGRWIDAAGGAARPRRSAASRATGRSIWAKCGAASGVNPGRHRETGARACACATRWIPASWIRFRPTTSKP
jgi:hypothetical protein